MLDNLLINRFLNKNFTVIVDGDYFCFKDNYTGEVYNVNNFCVLFEKIFSYYLTDELTSPLMIVQVWFDARKYEITKDIYDYLSTCRIKLGRLSWEIYDSKNNMVTEDNIIKLTNNSSYNKLFINIFNKWFDDEVILVSSKLINNYE